MKFAKLLRQEMLGDVARPAIMAGDKKIKFYEGNDLLCEVQFSDLVIKTEGVGDSAVYVFTGSDGLDLLIGAVSAGGTVSRFKIQAEVGSVLDNDAISGSVGAITSGADIKFNNVSWQPGMTITLRSVSLILGQGA
jgi:hypothetical protein